MNIAIVDDEKMVVESLKDEVLDFLETHNLTADIRCFYDAESFVGSLGSEQYAIVLMDIFFQPGAMSGIDASRKLTELDPFSILIFMTDSGEHLSDAFSVHAFSYIVKEKRREQLKSVLTDALRRIPLPRNLVFMYRKQQISVPFYKLSHISMDGHYAVIRDIDARKWRVRMTFNDVHEMTKDGDSLLLINRGIVVNMEHIQSIERNVCTMTDGTRLPVRVRDRNRILESWHRYMFNKIRRGHTSSRTDPD